MMILNSCWVDYILLLLLISTGNIIHIYLFVYIHTYIGGSAAVVYLDCGQSEHLCPTHESRNITLNCSISGHYLEWAVNGDSVIEFTPNTDNNTPILWGHFIAKHNLTSSLGIDSTLLFNSSLVSIGTNISCRDSANHHEKICQTKLYGEPKITI